MTDSPGSGQSRVRFEARALALGIAFVLGLFVVISYVDVWRHPGQHRDTAADPTTLEALGAPRSQLLPDFARDIEAVWDTESGAAMLRFSYPEREAPTVEADLDRGHHTCPELSQYWRVDHGFWCADRDDLRRRCVDGRCLYVDPARRHGFIRQKGH